MENEDSLWSTWKSWESLWVDGAHMKQVVDGTHASPQVEQYENNLNECLWLSREWLVGKAHMLIDLEEKCFSPFKLYQRLAVWWVGWAFFYTLATWLKRIVNDWNFAGSPGAFTSAYDYVLIVLYTNNCIEIVDGNNCKCIHVYISNILSHSIFSIIQVESCTMTHDEIKPLGQLQTHFNDVPSLETGQISRSSCFDAFGTIQWDGRVEFLG